MYCIIFLQCIILLHFTTFLHPFFYIFLPPLMFFLLGLLTVSANILLQLEPNKPRAFYLNLDQDSSSIQLKLFKIDPESYVTYSFSKADKIYEDSSSEYEDYFLELENEFTKKITEKGSYKLVVVNKDSNPTSVNIYTHTNKVMGNEDADVKAIKKLFSDIENKLISLYNSNMRLKSMQDKNILEARRIIKGLYVMFLIPLVYFLVGFVKVRATKMMFAPKKGLKPWIKIISNVY